MRGSVGADNVATLQKARERARKAFWLMPIAASEPDRLGRRLVRQCEHMRERHGTLDAARVDREDGIRRNTRTVDARSLCSGDA